MQLQGLLFILFMMIAIPLTLLITDHNTFFVIIAIIIFTNNIKNISNIIFDNIQHIFINNEENEDLNEIEEIINLDVKKIGKGARVVKVLVVILFFIYCIFYIKLFWMKSICVLLITYWSYSLFNTFKVDEHIRIEYKTRIENFFSISIDLLSIIIILSVIYKKFYYP